MFDAILSVLMPTLSGGKDEYLKDVVPPEALSFDRIMQNKPTVSGSRLFLVPVEILGHITRYLSFADLQNLAYVNSDCRQLARSHLFKSVILDYSLGSSQLLHRLCSEALERSRATAPGAYIGSCIRHLTIATRPVWVERRHGLRLEMLETLDQQVAKQRIAEASKTFVQDAYLVLETVLSAGAMPHLELVNWEDKTAIPKSLFAAILRSDIQHLRLYKCQVDAEVKLQSTQTLAHDLWPLRSLHLEVSPILSLEDEIRSVMPVKQNMLRRCAPTLEILKWVEGPASQGDLYSFATFDSPIRFPRLRRLTLGWVEFLDLSVLNAFLGPGTKVRELGVKNGRSNKESDLFTKQGNIQTLEALSCSSPEPLAFLRANPQLSKLMIERPIPAASPITLLLSTSFNRLASLSLHWEDGFIPGRALEQIGTLQSLNQLQLGAGCEFGWRHNWFIDHDLVRSCFVKLKNLRKLAICRDAYGTDDGSESTQNYYGGSWLRSMDDDEHAVFEAMVHPPAAHAGDAPDTELSDSRDRLKAAFHRIHGMRMAKEATKYGQEIPSLDWIYLGKLPFDLKEDNNGKKPVCLTDEMDECWTFLRRTFGLRDSGD